MTDTPIYLFMVYAAIYTWIVGAGLLVMLFKGKAIVAGLLAFCRRTFTKAGDLPDEAQRRAHVDHVFAEAWPCDPHEDQRRREAFTAFDEIELDLEDAAVN